MKTARVLAVATREIAAIRRSRALWIPMLALPAIVFVALPLVVALLPQLLESELIESEAQSLIERLPPDWRARFAGQGLAAVTVELIARLALAPLFVLVPVATASLVAAAAFAGERERGTLEPLLHAPVTDRELFTGKVLGALLPALFTCALGLVLVSVVLDVAAWPLIGHPLLPDPLWLAMTLVLAPAIATLAVLFTVFVSARVRGFQEANQLSVVLVLPIVGLMVGQLSGVVLLRAGVVLAFGLSLFVLDGALLWLLAGTTSRERLLGKT